MPRTVTIELDRPIASSVLTDSTAKVCAGTAGERASSEASEQDKERLVQARRALEDAAGKLNELRESTAKEYKERIAKLAVAIAGKILAQKVEKGAYEIESVVKQALNSFGTDEDVTVHLNPVDVDACRQAFSKELSDAGCIKFVRDPQIGRAECLVTAAKGIIKSSIDEQLERIAEALKKV
jgi:flagellar biosynthesis/type III secretory pathway protein FliH